MINFTLPENQHPVLKLFPLMPPDELRELAEDIKQNGQREDAVYIETESGPLLIDGQNRAAACKMAGVPLNAYCHHGANRNGADPQRLMGMVLSKNLRRRHLTPAQRGAIAVSASDLLGKLQAEAKAREQAARDKANAERKAIAEAAKAIQKDPEGAEAAAKQMTEAAVAEVQQQPDERGRTNDKIAALADISPRLAQSLVFVGKHAPAYLPKIIEGSCSVDHAEKEAHRIAAEKRRKEKRASKPEKQAKPKPEREFGIFKVGAILLGTEECRGDRDVKPFAVPLLFEVVAVKEKFAECREVSSRCSDQTVSFRMEKSSGKHEYRSTRVLRIASAADKKMVDQVWEVIRRKVA